MRRLFPPRVVRRRRGLWIAGGLATLYFLSSLPGGGSHLQAPPSAWLQTRIWPETAVDHTTRFLDEYAHPAPDEAWRFLQDDPVAARFISDALRRAETPDADERARAALQYLETRGFTSAEYLVLYPGAAKSLSESGDLLIGVHPQSGRVERARGLAIPAATLYDVDVFVLQNFGTGYQRSTPSDLSEDEQWIEYAHEEYAPDVSERIEVAVADGVILSFSRRLHYDDSRYDSVATDGEGVARALYATDIAFSLAAPFAALALLAVYRRRISRAQVLAGLGVGLLIVGSQWLTRWLCYNYWIDPQAKLELWLDAAHALAAGAVAVFAFRARTLSAFFARVLRAAPLAIVTGLALFALTWVALDVFYWLAHQAGAWMGDHSFEEAVRSANPWRAGLFLLTFPIAPALGEELVYRRLLSGELARRGVPTLVVMILSSFLWGIAHLGYMAAPWYLYLLDFMLFTGPLYYFAYRQLGLGACIALHYCNNLIVMATVLLE
jgi:membrane protease YdiL (CAAX protease family)